MITSIYCSEVNKSIPNVVIRIILKFANTTKCIMLKDAVNLIEDEILANIKDIYRQGFEVFMVDSNNKLFVIEKANNEIYSDKFFWDTEIKLVSKAHSSFHAYALTMDNQLYLCKDSSNKELEWNADPVICQFSNKIISINTGLYHSLFLTNNNLVYGVGDNEFYQLGLIEQQYNNITLINTLNEYKIRTIIATAFSSLFLDDKGILLGCGKNDSGMLGHDTAIKKLKLNELFDKNIKVKEIKCGYGHILARYFDENVYAWGSNSEGQCGKGKGIYVVKPSKIEIKGCKNIKSFYCNRFSTILMDYDDNLFVFGANNKQQCIIDTDEDDIFDPVMIGKDEVKDVLKTNKNIVDIVPCCDFYNCFFVQ